MPEIVFFEAVDLAIGSVSCFSHERETVVFNILHFWGSKEGLVGKATRVIDRARRVLLGTSADIVGTSSQANRGRKYANRELRYPRFCI